MPAVQVVQPIEVPAVPLPCSPLLKWAGGKTLLLPELVKRMPKAFGRYLEPFAGGAALFFHLARPGSILGDVNADLIRTYSTVAAMPGAVIQKLRALARERADMQADRHYYAIRTRWNSGVVTNEAERAAMMLYINRLGYNGLWRVNRHGELNVPVGMYDNPTICDAEKILDCARVLGTAAKILPGSYLDTVSHAKAGDFVYCDSPYVPASKTAKFTGYTKDGFGEEDQEALAMTARQLVDRGVYVMLSNADVPLVRTLYRKDFTIARVKAVRAINSKGGSRGAVNEVIITGGYKP